MRRLGSLFALLVALVALPASLYAQGGGTISGRVTGGDTGGPIASATVNVQGTALRGVTDSQGRYSISGVPAGTYTLTASTLGAAASGRQVTVTAGQTTTADFTLATRAIQLEGLVATATGEEQRQREVGNVVGKVNVAEDVQMASVNDVGQVLQGRTAGVSVLQSSGTSGTGARIRIRGSNSVSLSNDPLWIIDGVRSEAGAAGYGVGGQTASRQLDINPEDIENIEVIKGPAAAALYGTAAANGVIVVTTKKGRAGRTRFTAYSEMGNVEDVSEWPANFNGFCSYQIPGNPSRTNFNFCWIEDYTDPSLVALDVRLDSIVSFNPLEDPRTTPFETGDRRKFGLSASGGNERVTFFTSGDFEDEDGVYKYDVSASQRRSIRANMRAQFTDDLDLTLSSGYINAEIRLPQNDNNALGLVSGALLSQRFRYDSISGGYGFGLVPRTIANYETRNRVDRITGSLQANYKPLTWLSFTGQAGIDRVGSFDVDFVGAGLVPYSATYLEGFRSVQRTGTANYTGNFNASADYTVARGGAITGKSSTGFQYSEELSRFNSSGGAVLLAGVPSLSGANARFSANEGNAQVRTVGTYFQQQFGLNDRLFLTGSVRADRNSAFGSDFGWVAYPSLSASWVVAEEPWFPQVSFLNTLRVRAAYGSSGLRPGSLDAFRFLNPVAVTQIRSTLNGTSSVPGISAGGAGNVDLKPEKSTEVELGFDAGLFDDRLGLEFTYFNKTAEDALVNVPLAPSLGSSAARRENLGSVKNHGVEGMLNARILELDNFRWDATLTATSIHNELETLGERINPIIFGLGGSSQRHTPGRELGAYYARPYTFEDANGDGLISSNELTFTSDTTVYVGSPFPKREASLQTNLQIFDWIRVSTLFDYRGGYKNFNSTEEFRCGSFYNCSDIVDPTTPLEEQAAAAATLFFDSWYGYIEDADFVKWRELSLTLGLPEGLAQRLRTQGISLTLSGRNLKTWTDYRGLDPEINFAGTGSNFSTAEFLTQPPARYFTARLDVTF